MRNIQFFNSPIRQQAFKTSHRRSGQAMVEMAMCVIILLTILIGIMEVGWLVKNSNTIVNASREGARYASLGKGAALVRARVQSSSAPMSTSVPMSPTDADITLQFYSGTGTPTNTDWVAWPPDSGTGTSATNNVPFGAQLRVTVVATSSSLTGFIPALRNRRIFQYTVMRRER